MHERDFKQFSAFQMGIQAFICLCTGKCHFKKNDEKRNYPHRSFFGENIDFLSNHVKFMSPMCIFKNKIGYFKQHLKILL